MILKTLDSITKILLNEKIRQDNLTMATFLFKKFYSINPPQESPYQSEDNINSYLDDVYKDIVEGKNRRRAYQFSNRQHPAGEKTQNLLTALVVNADITATCNFLAQRLKECEDAVRPNAEQMGIEMQKGMLVLFLAENENGKKIVLAKVDSTAIIEDGSGDRKEGVDENRKVFKVFVADVDEGENGQPTFNNLLVIDSNTKQSVFWWRDFLLLEQIRKDNENTKKAIDALTIEVINPVKKKNKQDYVQLRSLIYSYFKTNDEFDIEDLANNKIGRYVPVSDDVNVEELKIIALSLPGIAEFDTNFVKDPKEVDKKYKKVVKLSDTMELVLKAPIPEVMEDITLIEEEGSLYLKIRTPDGHKYFTDHKV